MFIGQTEEINTSNALSFPIHGFPDHLRPILEMIPLQVLAYKLSQAQGIIPGLVRYITKVILSEEGIPNQYHR